MRQTLSVPGMARVQDRGGANHTGDLAALVEDGGLVMVLFPNRCRPRPRQAVRLQGGSGCIALACPCLPGW